MKAKRYDDKLLKRDARARADAIRDVISLNVDASAVTLMRKCIEANIPTHGGEVQALRQQYMKVAASTAPKAVVSAIRSAMRGDPEAATAELYDQIEPAVRGEMEKHHAEFVQKVLTAPLPLKVQLTQLNLDKLKTAEMERKRKEITALERDIKRDKAQLDRLEALAEENTAKEKRLKAGLTPLAAEAKLTPPRLAETAPLPEAVAQRFSDKLEGKAQDLPTLPPELEIGKQDNAEGSRVRLRWVEDLFLQKPQLNSNDAYMLLQATFGIGINNLLILEALKAVRELNGMRFITRRRSEQPVIEVPAPAPPVKRVMDPATRLLVTWPDCGPPVPATVGTLGDVMTTIEAMGVDLATCETWRPMKVKTAVKVVTTVTAEVDDD